MCIERREVEMFQNKYCFALSDSEFRILVKSLIRFRNSLIQKGSTDDLINDVITKVLLSPTRKV